MTDTVEARKGHNSQAGELAAIAERIAGKMEEITELNADVKAIMEAAKGLGYDGGAIKQLVQLRDEEKRAKFQKRIGALIDYSEALGEPTLIP